MLLMPEKYCAGPTGKLFLPYGGKEFDEFKTKVDDALLKLKASPLGERLLTEIVASKKTVSIYRFPQNTCAIANEGDADASCYREVLDDEVLHTLLVSMVNDGPSAGSTEFRHACRKLNIEAARTVAEDKGKMTVPKFSSNTLGRGKAGYWISHKLTPGEGADAIVRWNPDNESAWPLGVADAPNWSARPAWISLAHELIHAWRLVSGFVVFHPSADFYYEEAMTVGLAPYERCIFTENAFRLLGGLPRRTFYGPPSKARTDKAAAKSYT